MAKKTTKIWLNRKFQKNSWSTKIHSDKISILVKNVEGHFFGKGEKNKKRPKHFGKIIKKKGIHLATKNKIPKKFFGKLKIKAQIGQQKICKKKMAKQKKSWAKMWQLPHFHSEIAVSRVLLFLFYIMFSEVFYTWFSQEAEY